MILLVAVSLNVLCQTQAPSQNGMQTTPPERVAPPSLDLRDRLSCPSERFRNIVATLDNVEIVVLDYKHTRFGPVDFHVSRYRRVGPYERLAVWTLPAESVDTDAIKKRVNPGVAPPPLSAALRLGSYPCTTPPEREIAFDGIMRAEYRLTHHKGQPVWIRLLHPKFALEDLRPRCLQVFGMTYHGRLLHEASLFKEAYLLPEKSILGFLRNDSQGPGYACLVRVHESGSFLASMLLSGQLADAPSSLGSVMPTYEVFSSWLSWETYGSRRHGDSFWPEIVVASGRLGATELAQHVMEIESVSANSEVAQAQMSDVQNLPFGHDVPVGYTYDLFAKNPAGYDNALAALHPESALGGSGWGYMRIALFVCGGGMLMLWCAYSLYSRGRTRCGGAS